MLPILELRQHTLHSGQRDVLIKLFDRELVETKEATGMHIAGQFRDTADADQFVWIRGFAHMGARRQVLTDFYVHGETWRNHGAAARATMIDSRNALLLRPTSPEDGFGLLTPRPPVGSTAVPCSRVIVVMCQSRAPFTKTFVDFFGAKVKPYA